MGTNINLDLNSHFCKGVLGGFRGELHNNQALSKGIIIFNDLVQFSFYIEMGLNPVLKYYEVSFNNSNQLEIYLIERFKKGEIWVNGGNEIIFVDSSKNYFPVDFNISEFKPIIIDQQLKGLLFKSINVNVLITQTVEKCVSVIFKESEN